MRDDYILIVEDDDELRGALSATLANHGYRVKGVGDGAQALRLLQSEPPPCLILLDVTMPVMNGYAFRREQLQDPALASIPVIAISGFLNPVERLADLEVQEYLTKPLDVDWFLEIVARYCDPDSRRMHP
jgi:CheY-like chemotaxis protein